MSVPMSRPSRRAVVMSSLFGGTSGLLAQFGPVESSQIMEGKVDGPSPPPSDRKVTVERRGKVCLSGLNRPTFTTVSIPRRSVPLQGPTPRTTQTMTFARRCYSGTARISRAASTWMLSALS